MGSGPGNAAPAALKAVPLELLGQFAKHCQVCGHVIPITDLSCTICQDANARNREAGRDETTPADEEAYGNEE